MKTLNTTIAQGSTALQGSSEARRTYRHTLCYVLLLTAEVSIVLADLEGTK